MYNDTYFETLNAALEDEAFAEAARNAANKEALVKLFAEKNIPLEDEAAQAIYDKLASLKAGDELSEEDMELVAGGAASWRQFLGCFRANVVTASSTATCGNTTVKRFGVGVALRLFTRNQSYSCC